MKALLPEAGFIAEEGSGSLTSEESCWLVDPLDGTTNFIHDNAPYCVSIALRNREELLLGVVYEVCRNEYYWARRGGKAYLNGEEIHVSSIAELDKALDEYAELKAQAADFDPVELYKARQVIRPALEKAVKKQLEDTMQEKPSLIVLLSAKQEASRLLGEDTEERQVRQLIMRRQKEQRTVPQNQSKKKEHWER